MRAYSQLAGAVQDAIAFPPDSVQTLLLGSSVAQALGWPTSTGGTTAARTVGAHIVRFTAMSSAAGQAPLGAMVNLVSTHALNPSSGTSVTTGTTANSTGNNIPIYGSRTFQIPAWSTGWSAIMIGSGYLIAEIWKR